MNMLSDWLPLLTQLAIKGTLLMTLALGAGLALRSLSASRRYLLWLAAALGGIALPMGVFLLPSWQVLPPLAPTANLMLRSEEPSLTIAGEEKSAPLTTPKATIPTPIQPPLFPVEPTSPASSRQNLQVLPFNLSWQMLWDLLPALWLTGAGFMFMRLGFSAWRLQRLTRKLEAVPDPLPSETLATLQTTLGDAGLHTPPQMLSGPPDSVPMVWGIFRPHLLLPEGFEKWPEAKLRAVLLHELAHLKRRDPLALWIAQVMQALHWFNPLAWFTLRRLRADQERACDDAVLRQGIRASDYAQHLLDLSRHHRLGAGLSLCTLAMARPAPVEDRVTAILDPHRARHVATRRWAMLLVSLGLATALPLAMLQALEIAKVRGRILDRNGAVLAETKYDVRQYPLRSFAGHVLGYTSTSHKNPSIPEGRDGLEKYADAILRAGKDVRLTLDARIQKRAEKELMKSHKNGAIVVLDTATGEVLALASWPCFDPNLFSSGPLKDSFENLVNNVQKPLLPRAFRAEYPPGGVFRLVTAMAAMAEGRPDAVLYCEGSTQIGSRSFQDWQSRPHGPLSLEEALVQTCNSYTYQMANLVGGDKLLAMALTAGFGTSTGLSLISESSGHIPSLPKPTDAKNLAHSGYVANIAIGQGTVLATPLQLAVFTSIIANKGKAWAPTLMKDQQATKATGPELREEDWETLRRSMKRIVNETTGHLAKSEACEIAVMTGTSQWRLSTQQHLATLVGFAPYDQPRIAFAIVLEGDPNENLSGGSLCAPIAKQIVERFLALPADGTEEVRPWQELKAEHAEYMKKQLERLEKQRATLPPEIREKLRQLKAPFQDTSPRKSIKVDWTPRISPET